MAVIVNMACGLANRMFQYSYYLYLKKLGYDVCVDFYTTAKLAHEHVEWESVFPHAPICQASGFDIFRTGGGSDLFSKVRRRYFGRGCKLKYTSSAFDVYLPDKDVSLIYVTGVFQNAGMVDYVRKEVEEAFAFPMFPDGRNLVLAREMQKCQSVAIHVRKGKDYASRHWYTGTCPVDYYLSAVELMKTRLDAPRFYVFTDNPDWVRENFTGFAYALVTGNPVAGPGSHYDMQLMSLCRHNIISNSTYSWWGAYLNRHDDKIVVAPDVWFNPESCKEYRSEKIICRSWFVL